MKKISIAILLCVVAQYGVAQFPDMLISSNQQLVEDAVKDGLMVIRRDYRLQKTVNDSVSYYGRNGKDYFGQAYSLGVKVNGGFYTLRSMLKPWETDENYERYRNDAAYEPVIFNNEHRYVEAPEYASLYADWTKTKAIASLMFVPDSINDGFAINHSFGEKNGWIVLVTSEGNWEEDDEAPFALVIYRNSIQINDEEYSYTIKPPSTTQNILGGIYVCPEVSSVGKVTFLLAGMIENDGENWKISIVTDNIKTKDNDELNLIQDSSKDRPRKDKGK